MKVAAYQMSVDDCYSMNAVARIAAQVRACEALDVSMLCCPEGALGGLADYVEDPASIAIETERGALSSILGPLASETVTTVVGFTEIGIGGRLYNSAAVFRRGSVVGLYRKRHPAIHASRYAAGTEAPVFTIAGQTFGILICRDSVDDALAEDLVRRGARALFIPTNNAMPRDRHGPDIVAEVRALDARRATALDVDVVRADVVGDTGRLAAYATSAITGRRGLVLSAGRPDGAGLLVADLGDQ